MSKDRINFKYGIQDTLYKKTNGKCSFPRCNNPTMGPTNDGSVVNMGIACHIYSASPRGPRGQGGKDADFISSEKNGIWCCVKHAGLIDKNNGRDYPAATLFAWKNLAEARVKKQMDDIPSPLGWVSSIELLKFENLKNPPKINLSRKTFIFGRNCSGKSSLMEVAASICQSKYSTRFKRSNTISHQIDYPDVKSQIIYSTVDSFSKTFTIEVKNGVPARFDGTTQCILPPGDITVIYCSSHENRHHYNEDDIDFITRYLNIDESSLLSIIKHRTNELISGEIKFIEGVIEDDFYDPPKKRKRKKEDEENYRELHFKHTGREFWIPYENLSTSEKGLLLLDLAITTAREISKQRLTLLMIDDLIYNFDEFNFKKYVIALSDGDFQVLSILPPRMEDVILDKINGTVELKSLDYLVSWRIEQIHRTDE